MSKVINNKQNKIFLIGIISIVMLSFVLILISGILFLNKENEVQEDDAIVDTTYFISDVPITYTAFLPVNNDDQDFVNNPVWIKLQEMTNIHFDFISPVNGDESEEVLKNLFVQGDYPDLILNSTAGYAGGFTKAVNDGIYIDIMPYLEEYAPNYNQILKEYSNELSSIYTEKDQLPGFWEIFDPKDSIPIIGGMTIRKDMLEETGQKIPQTIDEWTELMRELAKIDSIEYPLIFGQQNGVNVTAEFLSAYGIGAAPISVMNPVNQLFYPVENEVRYGAIESGYKEYLLQMNQWYTEGLLDKDFGVRRFTDLFERSNLITSGKSAINWQYSEWLSSYMQDDEKSIEMVAAPMPKLTDDDGNVMWMVSRKPYTGKVVSITTQCENVIPLIEFFDFLYSKEGILLQNYGIEGDTYTIEDGQPMYTSKIMNYKKGPFEGIGKYISNNSAVMYNLSYTNEIQLQLYGEEALEMKKVWLDSVRLFSMNVDLTVEESSRLVKIMNSITKYVTEYTIKAIVDRKVAMNWDENIKIIQIMGIEEAIDIMQNAYDRQRWPVYESTPQK